MDHGNLPIGFAMALAQNQTAMEKFGTMPELEKRSVISRAHSARSEAEMHQIVSSLVPDNTLA